MALARTTKKLQLDVQLYQSQAGFIAHKDPKLLHASKLDVDMLSFAPDQVIIHITGNSQHRTIFIERSDGFFHVYSIKTNSATAADRFLFSQHTIDIAQAREEFRKMGFYFFKCWIAQNKVQEFISYLHTETPLALKNIDKTINQAVSKLFSDTFREDDEENDGALSLFDPENAEQISSAKTKYDLWLEEWQKPAVGFAFVQDREARKLLELLQQYLRGGKIGRFLSGHWKQHHCDAVTSVLTPYKVTSSDKSFHAEIATEKDADDMQNVPLETTLRDATVKSILQNLRVAIDSELIKKKPHGELFNLLEVVKDQTQVAFFDLEFAEPNPLLEAQY